jgi:hypothetical protein
LHLRLKSRERTAPCLSKPNNLMRRKSANLLEAPFPVREKLKIKRKNTSSTAAGGPKRSIMLTKGSSLRNARYPQSRLRSVSLLENLSII